jgi:hypothetical protein
LAVANLDAWAASLPRRGRVAIARALAWGQEVSDEELRVVRTPSVSLFADQGMSGYLSPIKIGRQISQR